AGVLRAEGDEAEAVAAPRCGVADRERDAFGDVRLAPLSGTEVHRRRGVEDEPRDEDTFRQLDADMRQAGARSDVPVDAAHVVAGLIRADLMELGAEPGERRAVVAGEQAVDAARDRELEGLEALGCDRAGARPRGRAAAGRRRRRSTPSFTPHRWILRLMLRVGNADGHPGKARTS